MSSLRQIEANRRNALKSTGPRTEAGKQASRFNALKHSIDAESLIIPGEDASALEALSASYIDRFLPHDPVEQYLVETLIHCDWLRRRLLRVQAAIFSGLGRDVVLDNDPLRAAVRRGAFGPDSMQRIYQQLANLDRSYLRALKELRRAQEERKAQEIKPVSTPATNPLRTPNGFVPENPSGPRSEPISPSPTPSGAPRTSNFATPADV